MAGVPDLEQLRLLKVLRRRPIRFDMFIAETQTFSGTSVLSDVTSVILDTVPQRQPGDYLHVCLLMKLLQAGNRGSRS